MKKLLGIVVLSLFYCNIVFADQAQLFGIKMYKDLFQSIDEDTWLKEKCIKKSSYNAFIRYQEVPLYTDLFPVVNTEVDKCKVFAVWGQGFFKRKGKCRKQIEPIMQVTIKRLKEDYEVSKIQKGNPLRDDKHSKYAIISGKDRKMILYGYCFKDPQGYFMDYGLVDAERTKDHSKYEGVTNLLQGL